LGESRPQTASALNNTQRYNRSYLGNSQEEQVIKKYLKQAKQDTSVNKSNERKQENQPPK